MNNGWITKIKNDADAGTAPSCPCASIANGEGRFRSDAYDPEQGGWVLDALQRQFQMYGPNKDPNDPGAWSYAVPLDYDVDTGEFSINGHTIGAVNSDTSSADFGKFTTTTDFWTDIAYQGSIANDYGIPNSEQALAIANAPAGVLAGPWKIKSNGSADGPACTTYVESIDTSIDWSPTGNAPGGPVTFHGHPTHGGRVNSPHDRTFYIYDAGGTQYNQFIHMDYPVPGNILWFGPGFYYYQMFQWVGYGITGFSVGETCDTTPTPSYSTTQPGYGPGPSPLYLNGAPHVPGDFKNEVEATPTGGIVVSGNLDANNNPGTYYFTLKLTGSDAKNQYVATVAEGGAVTITPQAEGINPAALAADAVLQAMAEKMECNHKNVTGCKLVDNVEATVGDVVPDIVPEFCAVAIGNPTIKGEASPTTAANSRDIIVTFYPPDKNNPTIPNIPDAENPDEGGTPPGEDEAPDPGDTPPVVIPGNGGTNGGGTPNIPPPDPEQVIRFVPNTLDFQETGIGKYRELLFSIQNQGTTPVPVTNIIPAFAVVSGNFSILIDIPKTLEPGQSVAGKVTYWPREETISQEVFYAVTTGDKYLDALTLLGYATSEGGGTDPDPEPPTKILHLYESYFVNSTIVFGDTLYGETRTGFLYARNEGDLPVTFEGITLTGPYTISETINPQVIQPEMYLEIPIVFTPTGNGSFTGQAAVKSDADNADGEGKIYAGLIGVGYGYEEPPLPKVRLFELEADSQDFAFSPIGTPKSMIFRLKSVGDDPVTLYLLALRDPNPVVDPPAFVLSFPNYPNLDGTINNGITLNPGETSEWITLTFTPDRETEFSIQVFHQSLSNATDAPWGWDFTGLGYDPANDIPDEPIPPGPGPDPEPTPEGEPPSNNTYLDGVGPSCVAKPCVVKFIYKEKL